MYKTSINRGVSLLLLLFSGCTKANLGSAPDLIGDGRATYQRNCIACHSVNPKVDGPLGPALAGSSLELLEARVLRGEYPAGYKPKRKSHVMQKLPFLKDQIPALYAYLQSVRVESR